MGHASAKVSGSPDSTAFGAPKPGLKARFLRETKSLLVIFVYLWVLFGLFALHQFSVLAQHGIHFSLWGYAIGNAFVFAKVMLVAEGLNLARGFEGRPLIKPVLYKSIVFAAVFVAFHIVEQLVIGLVEGKTLAESLPSMGGGGVMGVAIVGAMIAVSLSPFFAFRELDNELGGHVLRDLFVTKQRKPGAAAASAG
jgi:hypothetical protein